MRRAGGAFAALLLAATGPLPYAEPALAQGYSLGVEAQIRTLDQERLFTESAFGRRAAAVVAAASRELAASNQRILEELTAEERELTERRAHLEPEEFRRLADDFDTRVEAIRREQEAQARAIGRMGEEEQQRFFAAAGPILVELMREIGVVAILDSRAVVLSSERIDFTDLAIQRLDEVLGDGADAAAQERAAPQTGAAPEPEAPRPAPVPEGPPLDLPTEDPVSGD